MPHLLTISMCLSSFATMFWDMAFFTTYLPIENEDQLTFTFMLILYTDNKSWKFQEILFLSTNGNSVVTSILRLLPKCTVWDCSLLYDPEWQNITNNNDIGAMLLSTTAFQTGQLNEPYAFKNMKFNMITWTLKTTYLLKTWFIDNTASFCLTLLFSIRYK